MHTAIHLLRCKAEPLPQGDAFAKEMTAVEVITESFLARPTSRVRRGSIWHIGNSQVQDGVIFFALGREAVLSAPEFDEKLREFREVEKRQAPFTVGVFDPRDQTVGILIRQGVSLNAHEVAGKLETLLEEPGIARNANRRIRVDYIPDPTGFIEAIETAFRVTRFEFSFTLPNPPKDEKYVQRPLKDFAKRARASEGKASVKGDDLDRGEVAELATAVAAAGDDASANVQMKPGQKIQRKRLRMNALREALDISDSESLAGAITDTMRRAFDRVSERYFDRTENE